MKTFNFLSIAMILSVFSLANIEATNWFKSKETKAEEQAKDAKIKDIEAKCEKEKAAVEATK